MRYPHFELTFSNDFQRSQSPDPASFLLNHKVVAIINARKKLRAIAQYRPAD
jgi:hypothetical protein